MEDKRAFGFYGEGKGVDGEEAIDDSWLCGLIATALSLGISKSSLLSDYYIDEIPHLLSHISGHRAGVQYVDVENFF